MPTPTLSKEEQALKDLEQIERDWTHMFQDFQKRYRVLIERLQSESDNQTLTQLRRRI
ncbi:hypothetical protein HY624_02265 [Candidatus Uhrbacteria bacterium]|nr:hypothetical protein [Candidatus Uhrbacteria bacterium]